MTPGQTGKDPDARGAVLRFPPAEAVRKDNREKDRGPDD